MSMSNGWEYYNHALIPTTAPHKDPDVSQIKRRSNWHRLADGRRPLFARWTTDFDCPQETNWWYLIKEAPYDVNEASSNVRRHIRQSLRKCTVKKISAEDCIEDLYRVYKEACARYQNMGHQVSYESFQEGYLHGEEQAEYWGGYDQEDRLIGYVVVLVWDEYVETSVAKFSAQYMNLRVSDALYHTILEYYLNQEGKKYVSSGQRSVNHVTNSQEYKINTFGFKKAYCRLHMAYLPIVAAAVHLIYPFRKHLKRFENQRIVHQLLAVLQMEEIVREERR